MTHVNGGSRPGLYNDLVSLIQDPLVTASMELMDHSSRAARVGAALILAAACWVIVQPFVPAIMLAIVLALSTWPAMQWLAQRFPGRRGLAGLICCLAITTLAVLPAAVLVAAIGDGFGWLSSILVAARESPERASAWAREIPLVGNVLGPWIVNVMSAEPGRLLAQLAVPARSVALSSGQAVAMGLLQCLVAALVLFVLYRDGELIASSLRASSERIFGGEALTLIDTARSTVVGIMVSVVGAGLAQATVATIGFLIAGVPNAPLLGALTFIVSLVPFGPPVIWLGASLWLIQAGHVGWTVFMLVYGLFGISSVDNILKPYLISRTSHLPFALTLIGIVGGVIAFGLTGVFLGPTLLALGLRLARMHLTEARPG